MEKRFEFSGTGGTLFVKFLVGALLTAITLGIYAPWFACNMYRYAADNTRLKGAARGDLQLGFNGTGGQLFVKALVGGLLTMITFGIYTPWFMVNLLQWGCESASARAADGTTYRLRFNGAGGALFVKFLVGAILTSITFGIYGAWFMVAMQRYVVQNTDILEGERVIGNQDFVATGGQLFVVMLVGVLLTMITFGIYQFWFQCKLYRFMAEHHHLVIAGKPMQSRFDGQGTPFFVLNLVGGLLTSITFGIYGAWFMANLLRFQINNSAVVPRALAARPAAA